MDGMLPYLLLNATGLGLFALAWLAARRGRRWALIGAAIVLALVVITSMMSWMPVLEATCFPFAWYIYLQSFVMPILFMAFFGLAVPQLKVPWNRVVVVVLAIGLYVEQGSIGCWWMVSRPEIGDERTPNDEHHLRQSTAYTCAPSAAAIAVSYLGIEDSERAMADRCLTRVDNGTTRFNTYRGLIISLAGTTWRARMVHADLDELCQLGQVTVIDFPDMAHALTTVGTGAGVILHDPLQPRPGPYSRKDLAERYGGVAILLERR